MSKPLVVVTGASSGIGAATAKAFAEAGHPQLLLARRVEKIEAMNLPNAICRKLDVMDVDGFRDAIAEAEAAHGKVDCLVNNAGVMNIGAPHDQSLTDPPSQNACSQHGSRYKMISRLSSNHS